MEINTYSILKLVLDSCINSINIAGKDTNNEYKDALIELKTALVKVMKFF